MHLKRISLYILKIHISYECTKNKFEIWCSMHTGTKKIIIRWNFFFCFSLFILEDGLGAYVGLKIYGVTAFWIWASVSAPLSKLFSLGLSLSLFLALGRVCIYVFVYVLRPCPRLFLHLCLYLCLPLFWLYLCLHLCLFLCLNISLSLSRLYPCFNMCPFLSVLSWFCQYLYLCRLLFVHRSRSLFLSLSLRFFQSLCILPLSIYMLCLSLRFQISFQDLFSFVVSCVFLCFFALRCLCCLVLSLPSDRVKSNVASRMVWWWKSNWWV